MKKLVLGLLVLIIISQVSAIETTLQSSYQPGQTLIATIEGNFIDNLKAENILFYSGRAYIPLIYDIAKIQDKYYLYAILPIQERNYTLIIKNAHYLEQGNEKQEDLQFNFSTQGNLSSFSVNPGFIITSQDFKIKVQANKNINLESNFLNSTQQITIPNNQQKTLTFSISSIKNFTFTSLLLKAEDMQYNIPVAIFASSNITEPETKNFKFTKSELNFTILKNIAFGFEISLSNTGQQDISNITLLSNSKFIKNITPNKIEIMKAGTLEKINLTLLSDKEGIGNGTLEASSDNYTTQIPFLVTTTNKDNFQNISNNSDIINQGSCSDLNGIICKADETCEGTTKIVIGGLCCIGTCKAASSGSSSITYIIVIIAALAIIGFFVYRKLKFKKTSSKEILKAKEKSYEERFQPQETKGSLTRI
jgi:hypothetical protein